MSLPATFFLAVLVPLPVPRYSITRVRRRYRTAVHRTRWLTRIIWFCSFRLSMCRCMASSRVVSRPSGELPGPHDVRVASTKRRSIGMTLSILRVSNRTRSHDLSYGIVPVPAAARQASTVSYTTTRSHRCEQSAINF